MNQYTIHSCGQDVEALEDFTWLGSAVKKSGVWISVPYPHRAKIGRAGSTFLSYVETEPARLLLPWVSEEGEGGEEGLAFTSYHAICEENMYATNHTIGSYF